MCMIKLKHDFFSTLFLLYMLIISSESDRYKGVQKEKLKLPLKYMTGYFCRIKIISFDLLNLFSSLEFVLERWLCEAEDVCNTD